jgi:Domain of unknown function (DUF4168)
MERRFIVMIAAAAAMTLGSAALAQRPPQPAVPAGEQVSDADLEKFADIYVELRETADKFERQLSTAANEEQARNVQTQLQTESLATVDKHGWTPEKYNTVVEAISTDPELAQKTLDIIGDRLPETAER